MRRCTLLVAAYLTLVVISSLSLLSVDAAPGDRRVPRPRSCAALSDASKFSPPIWLGSPPSSPQAYRVASPADAQAVLDGAVAPGYCSPVDELLAQLLLVKFNQRTGARGPVDRTIAATVRDADAFLGSTAWRDERPASPPTPDQVLQVMEWARMLKQYNIAASPAGRISPETIRRREAEYPGAADLLQRWQADADGACGFIPPADECMIVQQEEMLDQLLLPVVSTTHASDTPGRSPRERLSAHRANQQHRMKTLADSSVAATATVSPPPYQPYIAIRGSEALDPSIQGYTLRDWERWDGFDYRTNLLVDVSAIDGLNNQVAAFNAGSTPGAKPSAFTYGPSTNANFKTEWMMETAGNALRNIWLPDACQYLAHTADGDASHAPFHSHTLSSHCSAVLASLC